MLLGTFRLLAAAIGRVVNVEDVSGSTRQQIR
jgi:hypothetical protein